jgi:thiol-disulfide isomerase/thioredoxin
MGPILTETTTRANIANDDVHHENTPKVISFVYDSFLRDIYQHASYNKKKHKASAGFAIYFIAIYESSCDCSADLLSKVEEAAELLEKHFQKFQDYTSLESPVTLPMVGEVDVRDAIKNSDLQALFDIDDLPVLKMVLVEQEQNESGKERGESESFSTEEGKYVPSDSNIHSLDYVGKTSTAQDIFETILHYWYRFVIAQETEFSAFDKMLQVNATLENEDVILNQMSGKPIFTVTSMQEMTSFLNLHDPYMFRPIHQDYFGMSPREEYFVHSLMKDALVNEPYYAFVQCRSYENSVLSDQTLSLYENYEELALLYIHRKDVAFFAYVSDHSCDWMIDDNDYHKMIQTDDPMENDSNGIVRILAISHHFNSTDVNVERNWIPQAYFHSSLFKKTYQPASTNDIMALNLTDFAIVHTTPSILWLDRKTTATIAFPTYREIHFVLFIDAHSPRRKDGSFDYDSKSFQQSKHAIDLLYHASQQHRSLRPLYDVVFLIVPSTDVQILKTFGVDIWSDMDRRCSERMTTKAKTECFVDDIPQLPSAMITSRRESSKYMKVYHLELDKKSLSNHHPLHLGKASIPTSNPLSAFLQTYFDNRNALKPTIKSEYIDISHGKPSSGIKIATANTFDSMVLSPNKHSIVYLYTPTCGHCKRFHIIWKNFSLMIDKMNWRNQLDVITMDISKNDLFVELSVDHVPSVLFFRRGAKDRPEEMILEEDAIEGRGDKRMDHNLGGLSDAKDIVEWVLRMLGSEELQEWKRQTLIQLEKEKHDDLEEQEVNYAKGDSRQKSR